MEKKFKFKYKIGKIFKDKRGWLKKILDGNFSSCIEVFSKKALVKENSISLIFNLVLRILGPIGLFILIF